MILPIPYLYRLPRVDPQMGSRIAKGPKTPDRADGSHMEANPPIIEEMKASRGFRKYASTGIIIRFRLRRDGPPMNGEIGIKVSEAYRAESRAIKVKFLDDGLNFEYFIISPFQLEDPHILGAYDRLLRQHRLKDYICMLHSEGR